MTLSGEVAAALARVIGIDAQEIARREAFLEFDEADVRLLKGPHDRPQSAQRRFADESYAHPLEFDETRRFIRDPYALAHLKRKPDRHGIFGLKKYADDILASTLAGLAVLDESLKVQSINRPFRELFNPKNGEDLAGHAIEDILPLPGLREQAPGVLASGMIVRDIETVLPALAKSRAWMSALAFLIALLAIGTPLRGGQR